MIRFGFNEQRSFGEGDVPLNRKVIIVEGYLASGKSTFARQLSKRLKVPYLIKDTFKSALCKSIPIASRAESSLYSAATFDAMMYVMQREFEAERSIIIEGNFVPAGVKKVDEAGAIRQLIDQYGYTPLTFTFSGDTRVLFERFIAREGTPERGDANRIGFDIPYGLFDQWCRNLDAFDVGGETIPVDTTDFAHVDFDAHIEYARRFIGQTE